MRALRLCSHPECRTLVRSGKCDAHKRPAWAGHGSRHERGYGTNPDGGESWDVKRARILKRDAQTCGDCGDPAGTVDHRVPKAQGGTDDDSNLVACCSRCQARKAGREGAEARRATA